MSADPNAPVIDDGQYNSPGDPYPPPLAYAIAETPYAETPVHDESAGYDESAEADGTAESDSPAADPNFDLDEFLARTHVQVMAPRYRVSPKAPIAWTLESCWGFIMLCALQIGWFYYGDNVMAFWNWAAAVFTGWTAFFSLIVAPTWRYFVARWDFSDTAVYARSGWWTHHYRIAPISRLQTVHTKRNLFERMLGLGTVVASTASAHGSVEIPGMPVQDAERLAEHLLMIAEIDEGDAT